jgi:HEAT repeat protein
MLPARQYIHEVNASTALSSLNEFRGRFQKLYENSPIRAIKYFLYYAATVGFDPLSEAMAFWATNGTLYISILLDSEGDNEEKLALENAARPLGVLGQFDPQFYFKFAYSVAALTNADHILRALHLAPALGDYSILIPWLRGLEKNADSRVRARAAKLLCQLRPNSGNIQRHLQSADDRVRASALEALWDSKVALRESDAFRFFRSALTDSHHRVVANALVGLYRLGELEAMQKMISLSSNKQHRMRAAMAWAMGVVEDSRAIPTLEALKADRCYAVRQRANHSLAALSPQQAYWEA